MYTLNGKHCGLQRRFGCFERFLEDKKALRVQGFESRTVQSVA